MMLDDPQFASKNPQP
jgi:hypothetical protein